MISRARFVLFVIPVLLALGATRASASCVYTGVDVSDPSNTATKALIAGCNPWQGRSDGDFIILWDQQGNLLNPTFPDISIRTFTCNSATPAPCTLGAPQPLTTA